VLKGADFLRGDIARFLDECSREGSARWELRTEFHFGGFARVPPELRHYVEEFKERHGFAIDPIYGAKMFWALDHLLARGRFERGSAVVAVHTGGFDWQLDR
jgi:1-aminocyclopropane-1-carboxylate deaminase/D-cysteine desulfhydrase-like pyridoxal-dependent ACC family enzyme